MLTAVSTNRAAHTLEPSFGLREDEALSAKEDSRSSTRTLVQASLFVAEFGVSRQVGSRCGSCGAETETATRHCTSHGGK
jgi:hypothetical protein